MCGAWPDPPSEAPFCSICVCGCSFLDPVICMEDIRCPGPAAVPCQPPSCGSGEGQSSTGGAIRTLTLFFCYYGIHSLMVEKLQILRYLSW